jgi:hypothetical protein
LELKDQTIKLTGEKNRYSRYIKKILSEAGSTIVELKEPVIQLQATKCRYVGHLGSFFNELILADVQANDHLAIEAALALEILSLKNDRSFFHAECSRLPVQTQTERLASTTEISINFNAESTAGGGKFHHHFSVGQDDSQEL